jgi:uncharacterized membrane-anchored protein
VTSDRPSEAPEVFMPILSRRVSLLLLSFAFFLLLAPALFTPTVFAQEVPGIDLRTILPAATQGGIGIIMLIVFVIQAKKDKQKNDETLTLFTNQLANQNDTTKLAFVKYNEQTQQLIQLLKDEQDYKTELRGTLERILVETSTPAKCPILIGKKISIQVTE